MNCYYLILCLLLLFLSFYQEKDHSTAGLPDTGAFTDTIDGRPCGYYHIQNGSGIQVAFSTYGARIIRLLVPGKQGQLRSVISGYDSLSHYLHTPDKSTGTLMKDYELRHWNAIQPNDSTLDLLCDTLKLTCRLKDNTFSISTSQANDSLLQVADLFSGVDKRIDLTVCKKEQNHWTTITCTFLK